MKVMVQFFEMKNLEVVYNEGLLKQNKTENGLHANDSIQSQKYLSNDRIKIKNLLKNSALRRCTMQ